MVQQMDPRMEFERQMQMHCADIVRDMITALSPPNTGKKNYLLSLVAIMGVDMFRRAFNLINDQVQRSPWEIMAKITGTIKNVYQLISSWIARALSCVLFRGWWSLIVARKPVTKKGRPESGQCSSSSFRSANVIIGAEENGSDGNGVAEENTKSIKINFLAEHDDWTSLFEGCDQGRNARNTVTYLRGCDFSCQKLNVNDTCIIEKRDAVIFNVPDRGFIASVLCTLRLHMVQTRQMTPTGQLVQQCRINRVERVAEHTLSNVSSLLHLIPSPSFVEAVNRIVSSIQETGYLLVDDNDVHMRWSLSCRATWCHAQYSKKCLFSDVFHTLQANGLSFATPEARKRCALEFTLIMFATLPPNDGDDRSFCIKGSLFGVNISTKASETLNFELYYYMYIHLFRLGINGPLSEVHEFFRATGLVIWGRGKPEPTVCTSKKKLDTDDGFPIKIEAIPACNHQTLTAFP